MVRLSLQFRDYNLEIMCVAKYLKDNILINKIKKELL